MDCPAAEAIADLAMNRGDPTLRAAIADHASGCESCHAALVAVVGGPVERIDRYVIAKKLGSGGMGVVYRARDPELQRDVAIKMLYREASGERLRREAQALARLSHPNVVAVHDVGEHAGQMFIAMALVDGETLRRWVASGERSGAEIVRVLVEAARGIEAAHAAGLVHRDLKPDNVFVARDGAVLVGDFGLAHDRGEAGAAAVTTGGLADLTLTGTVLGTPAYMAPEQAAGSATARSDQFSFCITAYETLYGTRPFAGANLDEIIAAIRRGDFAVPRRDPGVPPGVLRALRRGLAADPAHRFASMTELRAALEPRRRRWPWLAGGLATAAIAGAAITIVATRAASAIDPTERCAPAETAFADTWNPDRRVAWTAELRRAGKRESATTELAARLDRYAGAWTALRHATCVAEVSGQLAAELAAQRNACLETGRAAFARVVAVGATADIFALWKRVATLPPASSCTDDVAVGPAHEALMLAFAQARTPADLEAIDARADRERDQHAQLAIALELATRGLDDNLLTDADLRLRRAITLAESLGLARERVRALALSSRSLCLQGRHDEADRFLEIAGAAGKRLDDPVALDDLLDARAECAVRRGKPGEALPLLVELLGHAEQRFTRDSLEVYALRGRLVPVYRALGKSADADRELAEWNRLYTLLIDASATAQDETRITSALQRGDIDAAIEYQRRIVASQAAAGSPELASSHVDLASMYEVTAAWPAAIASYTEAVALVPPTAGENPRKLRAEALTGRGEARLATGDFAAARDDLDRAIAEAGELHRADLVLRARIGLGRAAVELGDHARGLRLLRALLPELVKANMAFTQGEVEFAIARAAWETGDRVGARATATAAEAHVARSVDEAAQTPMGARITIYRRTRLAAIERWRDAHR